MQAAKSADSAGTAAADPSVQQQQHIADAVDAVVAAAVSDSSIEPGSSGSLAVMPANQAAATAAETPPDSTAAAELPASSTANSQEQPAEDNTSTAVTAARGTMLGQALVLSDDQPVLIDLSDISDPCQRLIEERRRLRGVGMHLPGEVRCLRL